MLENRAEHSVYFQKNLIFPFFFIFCSQENNVEGGKKDKKKKPTTKSIELPLESKTHGYAQTELNNYFEEEVSLRNLLNFSKINFF